MQYLLSFLLVGLLCVPAWAAFQGPTSNIATTTVRDALSATWDDTKMCLEGNITDKIATSHEKYTFRDGTGSLTVEIDDRVMAGVNITPATKVRICGEVDKEFTRSNEFEAKTIQILGQ